MDMVALELERSRRVLDGMKGESVEVYKALDSLWEILYLMYLETVHVLRSPAEQGDDEGGGKAYVLTPKAIQKLKDQMTKSEETIANSEKHETQGYM